MLVKVTIEVVSEEGEAAHYHKSGYEGRMGEQSMQELQGDIVVGMVNKGNAKAGIPLYVLYKAPSA